MFKTKSFRYIALFLVICAIIFQFAIPSDTTGDVQAEESYTYYVSVAPIGREPSYMVVTNFEIIDPNWIRLNEPNGKSTVINTHNYNITIEKTKGTASFNQRKSLYEERGIHE